MNTPFLYCALCWQEFDHPQEHDRASSDPQGRRLNGHCKGDIRRQERPYIPRVVRDTPPNLPDPGEPLFIR